MNQKDIDTMSAELSQEMALESLEKRMPPKLAYRWRRWIQKMKGTPAASPQLGNLIRSAIEEVEASKELKKNEAQASFYDNGIVKMDFGPEINPKVKEAALKWAKSKGLKAIEASLQKSSSEFSYTVFSANSVSAPGQCVKRIKWST